MEILVILIVLLIIISVYVALSDRDTTHLLLVLVMGWVAVCALCQEKPLPATEGFDEVMPDRLQDIYYFENTLGDTKYRNKDAYPYETDGKGPVLGPSWAVDNSDVVEDTFAYSRGVYGADPIKKRIGTYNAESFDNDDGLAKRQEYRSSINKRAVEGASRTTRSIFDKHFAAELAEEQSHPWWGGEHQAEKDYRAY